MTKIKIKKTKRGFSIGQFADRYDNQCSIQKSSIATEDCIWLGIDDAKPEIMSSNGWVKFEIPKEVSLNTRMHLTRKQVKELLPILQNFAETGELF